jgi:hypothetical protein
MARLVHITADTDAARIRRHGVRARRLAWLIEGEDCFVWAFPVLPSYTLTHQWSRELKRWGRHTLAAVTFAIGDRETVYVGHFSNWPLRMTAAQAIGLIRARDDPRGYEVMVPRRIEAREIRGIRVLPQAVGWRYWPEAKNSGRFPCECPVCAPRGEVKARRYRERIPLMQARFNAMRPPG